MKGKRPQFILDLVLFSLFKSSWVWDLIKKVRLRLQKATKLLQQKCFAGEEVSHFTTGLPEVTKFLVGYSKWNLLVGKHC